MNSSTTILEFVGIGKVEIPKYGPVDYWTREVPFAVFILSFCSFAIFLQILVMRVFLIDQEMKKLPAFQLMLLISIFDTIQLFIHLTAVFYLLDSRIHLQIPDFLIGAIMNSSWVVMLLLSILLNFNRISSIVLHFYSSTIFSRNMMLFYLSFIIFIWIIIFMMNIIGLSQMVYLFPAYTWHYLADKPYSALLRTISADISLIDVLFSLLAHALIFSYIQIKAALLSKREFTLTIQVLCISIFHILGYITWEYLPIPWELPIGVFLGHFVWMLWNSINPILYLFINPRIRRALLNQLVPPKNKNLTTIRSNNSRKIGLG
ncbi:unnamed protein product [Caenorhabditis angaria]|uniref:Uncharacterized protein n=1 Tax=Caenorhabditis angaria TaxID=860376 RepID=A0A9P1IPN9_9PELO|nr:unnamed protein product [Caenorhabditis angaria]